MTQSSGIEVGIKTSSPIKQCMYIYQDLIRDVSLSSCIILSPCVPGCVNAAVATAQCFFVKMCCGFNQHKCLVDISSYSQHSIPGCALQSV